MPSVYRVRSDERFRDLRDDGVSVGAEFSHAVGNPMSQRTKAGLSDPRFSVSARGEFDV